MPSPLEETPAPPHYRDRPLVKLQDRREELLRLPRDWNSEEQSEVRAIEAELKRRGVLSIGIDF